MFKKLINAIWPSTPAIDQSLLAKKLDSVPQPVNNQITDSVTQAVSTPAVSTQAEEIKKAVAKNAKPKTASIKPVVPKTAAEKKKSKKSGK